MPNNFESIVNSVLYVTLTGAVFKYLVWHFFFFSARIDREYHERIREATEKISAERFFPKLVEIIEAVERRKNLQPASRAATDDFLVELGLMSKQKELKAAAAQERRIKSLFLAYKRSCMPVALASIPFWLGITVLWATLLFDGGGFVYNLIAPLAFILGTFIFALARYKKRENRFLKELGK